MRSMKKIWFLYFHSFYYYNEEIPLQNEIIKSVINENDNISPDMWTIESNADLLLINSYEALNNIRPSVPTTIYLGGIHQRMEKSSMTPSLAQFLDESEAVVYVNLNNAIQEPSRLRKLLKAIEKMQVDIVWNSNYVDVNTTARIYQSSYSDQENILGKQQMIVKWSHEHDRDVLNCIRKRTHVFILSLIGYRMQ